MGEHIVRHGPSTRPLQPIGRRPTAEIPEQQLHDLLHNPTHDDLKGELEFIDAHPMVFPEFTPESLPSMSSPHVRPVRPARPDISTLAMPRALRPARTATAMPRAEGPALTATDIPSTERPTLPAIPRPLAPATASSEAEPHPVMARPALPPIDDAPREPLLDAATPRGSLPRNTWRAYLVLPIPLGLLALGTMAFLLLR